MLNPTDWLIVSLPPTTKRYHAKKKSRRLFSKVEDYFPSIIVRSNKKKNP
jgi:hypothetical protein